MVEQKQLGYIKHEDFDRGLKASYKLGVLDGRDDIRNQLRDMQKQLKNMLVSNKHLYQLLHEAHKEELSIKITPCLARNIIKTLKDINNNQYYQLRRKYRLVMGVNGGENVKEEVNSAN